MKKREVKLYKNFKQKHNNYANNGSSFRKKNICCIIQDNFLKFKLRLRLRIDSQELKKRKEIKY